MAFLSSATAAAIRDKSQRFQGYWQELQAYTKLGGDTTGTVTPSVLKRIDDVFVVNSDGTEIAATKVITNTIGSPSVALSVLGGGTSGFVILKGGRR